VRPEVTAVASGPHYIAQPLNPFRSGSERLEYHRSSIRRPP
jgi:hypothetical protein